MLTPNSADSFTHSLTHKGSLSETERQANAYIHNNCIEIRSKFTVTHNCNSNICKFKFEKGMRNKSNKSFFFIFTHTERKTHAHIQMGIESKFAWKISTYLHICQQLATVPSAFWLSGFSMRFDISLSRFVYILFYLVSLHFNEEKTKINVIFINTWWFCGAY